MKAVIQRVTRGSVCVEGQVVGSVEKGYVLLLGVMEGDTSEEMRLLAKKVAGLRIFSDENGKMNLSVTDIGGGVLVVSQFTLCADLSHGRRPSFVNSASPDVAEKLYLEFCRELSTLGVSRVEHGVFGAEMAVDIQNDGPVTIIMDTDVWKK